MKVTGIQPSDLEVEQAPPEDATEKDIKRYQIMERKRFNLLRKLEGAAESLDERDVSALINSTPKHTDNSLRIEKARIDKQKEKTKLEIQRMAIMEVEREKTKRESTKDWDHKTKLLHDLREEKSKKASERLEAKQGRAAEKLKEAKQQEAEDRRRLARLLQEQDERVRKNLMEQGKQRDLRVDEKHEKLAEIAKRQEENEEELFEAAVRKNDKNTMRMNTLETWMDSRRTEMMQKQLESRSSYSDRLNVVEENLAKQAQERAKSASDNLEKLYKARERAANNWSSLAGGAGDKRQQRIERWSNNRQVQQVQKRQQVQNMMGKLKDGEARAAKVVSEYREATIGKSAAHRDIFIELVQANKERNDRSGEMVRDHRIEKIKDRNSRSDSRQEQRAEASRYRVEAYRQRVAGMDQVEELSMALRGCSPYCVQDILTELGLPTDIIAVEASAEEADAAQSSANAQKSHGAAR